MLSLMITMKKNLNSSSIRMMKKVRMRSPEIERVTIISKDKRGRMNKRRKRIRKMERKTKMTTSTKKRCLMLLKDALLESLTLF